MQRFNVGRRFDAVEVKFIDIWRETGGKRGKRGKWREEVRKEDFNDMFFRVT